MIGLWCTVESDCIINTWFLQLQQSLIRYWLVCLAKTGRKKRFPNADWAKKLYWLYFSVYISLWNIKGFITISTNYSIYYYNCSCSSKLLIKKEIIKFVMSTLNDFLNGSQMLNSLFQTSVIRVLKLYVTIPGVNFDFAYTIG